jgi:CxxC-x17-CxxC domain-containing protein
VKDEIYLIALIKIKTRFMGNFSRDNRPGGGRGDRGFGGRDFKRRDFGVGGRPMMHKATCSDCGKECEVPFRPTGERPVFCNDCFRNHKNESRGNNYASDDKRDNTDQYKEQFRILNAKLDKILNALNPVAPIEHKDVLVKTKVISKKTKIKG